MPSYLTSVRINASLPDVFAAFSDPEVSAKYLSRVQRVERLADTSYREWRTLENGREIVQDLHVVALVPNERCTIASASAGVRFEFTASFEHASGETHVAIEANARGLTFSAKLFVPVVWLFAGASARKSLSDDLQELKRGLERSSDLHCPYCGDTLQPAGRELRCSATGALFSQRLSERFRAAYSADGRTKETPFPGGLSGPWFCPGDGAALVVAESNARCPVCSKVLNEFIYEIVELNPHLG